MPDRFSEEDFRKHLGTKFRVMLETEGAPEVELELDEVAPFPTLPHSRSDVERFSLYFRGPGNLYLPQRTYTLAHEQMGEQEIFLVPVSRDEGGFRYEAVFSYFDDK